MYSKNESAQLKEEFWTTFGKYMTPILSADGTRVNWVNYKTGEKHIYFKMQADASRAVISVEIAHTDIKLQQLYFEQFKLVENVLSASLEEEWTWALHDVDEYGKVISRIYKELSPISILNKNDWPQLISFFKPRIIALDNFWSSARYGFEALY